MKFLFYFFVSTVIGARADYTYDIIADRTAQTIAPDYPIVYMYYQISPTQRITYFVNINDENPFLIEYVILKDGEIIFYNDEDRLLNGCDVPADGSLDYLVVKMIQMNLMPDGKCPVKPGNYTVKAKVDPITVTMPEMLSCGDYSFVANLFNPGTVKKIWGLQVAYSFNIKNDGNCAS